MERIEVVCAICRHRFTVSEDLAEATTTCPRCGQQVLIPFADKARRDRPRLQVRRSTPISGGKACPACDAAMPEDAVICVHCGFDTRAGKTWQAKGSALAKWFRLMPLVGVLLLLGLVWTITKRWRESGPIGESPAPSPPAAKNHAAHASLPVQQPVASVTTSAPTQSAAETSTVSAVMTLAATTNAVTEPPARPSKGEIEIQLMQVLNARLPLYTRGAQAVLRQNNGLVQRGEIIVLGTNSVTLKTEAGIREIPLSLLDRDSRLRCDPGFRRHLVEARAEQMIKSSTP